MVKIVWVRVKVSLGVNRVRPTVRKGTEIVCDVYLSVPDGK